MEEHPSGWSLNRPRHVGMPKRCPLLAKHGTTEQSAHKQSVNPERKETTNEVVGHAVQEEYPRAEKLLKMIPLS